ncbi:MAG: hypothetical protein P4L69_08320 [Desulfosporosinus sp.]|nr:hypothetical protein [Desulfosporosinus sp.]
MFESVRDYITEVRIIFREAGLEFVGQDKAHLVVFRYVIIAKNIKAVGGSYEFDSPNPIEVCVKTRAIAAHLRCSSPRDIISFEIDPNVPDRLIFNVQNRDKISRAEIVLPIPDDPEVNVEEFNSLKWYGAVTMSSALFHDMIRDLSSADPNPPLVTLTCDGYIFTLTADGLMSRVTFTVTDKQVPPSKKIKKEEEEEEEHSEGEVQDDLSNGGVLFRRSAVSQWPVTATYPIAFMQRVAKAKNVCSKISILLRAEYPVAFVYDSQIGVLTYIISPRTEEDIGDPAPPPGAHKRPLPSPTAPAATIRGSYGQRQKRKRMQQPAVDDEGGESALPALPPIGRMEDEDDIAESILAKK